MKKILLPLEETERSLKALHYAVKNYSPQDAELVLLMVNEKLGYSLKTEAEIAAMKEIEEKLSVIAAALEGYKVSIYPAVGKAGMRINRVAREVGADLIVMTKSSKDDMLNSIGNTTAYVINNAPCDVVIISESSNNRNEYRGLIYRTSTGVVNLRGQLGNKQSECMLPSIKQDCIYHIDVTVGRVRFFHTAYNPDTRNWDQLPLPGQDVTMDISAGESRDILVKAGSNAGKADRIRVVNRDMRKEAVFSFRITAAETEEEKKEEEPAENIPADFEAPEVPDFKPEAPAEEAEAPVEAPVEEAAPQEAVQAEAEAAVQEETPAVEEATAVEEQPAEPAEVIEEAQAEETAAPATEEEAPAPEPAEEAAAAEETAVDAVQVLGEIAAASVSEVSAEQPETAVEKAPAPEVTAKHAAAETVEPEVIAKHAAPETDDYVRTPKHAASPLSVEEIKMQLPTDEVEYKKPEAPQPTPAVNVAPTPQQVPVVNVAPAPQPAPVVNAAPAPQPTPVVNAGPVVEEIKTAPQPAPAAHGIVIEIPFDDVPIPPAVPAAEEARQTAGTVSVTGEIKTAEAEADKTVSDQGSLFSVVINE
jgi:nucleotide-binding universal stress UspA family protein